MKQFAFQRTQRLLNARAFKNTFDQAKLRFSTPVLLVLAAETESDKPARLGLVVAKKHIKRAVDRNRFKRIARESFRHHQLQLQGLDLVVLARAGARRASDAEIYAILEKAWGYIDRKRLKRIKNAQSS